MLGRSRVSQLGIWIGEFKRPSEHYYRGEDIATNLWKHETHQLACNKRAVGPFNKHSLHKPWIEE